MPLVLQHIYDHPGTHCNHYIMSGELDHGLFYNRSQCSHGSKMIFLVIPSVSCGHFFKEI